jgi:hypothetical protein
MADANGPPEEADTLLGVVRARSGKEGDGLGLRARGSTVVPPKPGACTILRDAAHPLRIGIWETLSTRPDDTVWFRQTPKCLVESGYESTGLEPPSDKRGGGSTAGVRRAALGVRGDGRVAYVGLATSVAESTMARVMRHVGARDAVLVGNPGEMANIVLHGVDRGAKTILPGDPARETETRDFFYVVRATGR